LHSFKAIFFLTSVGCEAVFLAKNTSLFRVTNHILIEAYNYNSLKTDSKIPKIILSDKIFL